MRGADIVGALYRGVMIGVAEGPLHPPPPPPPKPPRGPTVGTP
jgi:hypothetical protein